MLNGTEKGADCEIFCFPHTQRRLTTPIVLDLALNHSYAPALFTTKTNFDEEHNFSDSCVHAAT